jgi:thiamine biosynthesis lipoprotein
VSTAATVPVLAAVPDRRAWVDQVMGMPVSIHLRGPGVRSAAAAARVRAAYDELRAVDVLFSPYRDDSDVSRIDRGELTVGAAHPLVGEVAALCDTARALTGGAFDAWRTDDGGRLRFDPTGLVKGWAVQRATDHLAAGLECDVSVNAGGDIAVRPGRDARPWRIGIEDPRDLSRVIAGMPVVAGGVATSGTAHRGPHLVDPRSGRAADEVLSVSVVGSSLLWADALATAAFVLGRGGLDLVETVAGYEAVVVDRHGVRTTTGLQAAQARTEDMSA